MISLLKLCFLSIYHFFCLCYLKLLLHQIPVSEMSQNNNNLVHDLLAANITLMSLFIAVEVEALTNPSISAPLKFLVSSESSWIDTSFASFPFSRSFVV